MPDLKQIHQGIQPIRDEESNLRPEASLPSYLDRHV